MGSNKPAARKLVKIFALFTTSCSPHAPKIAKNGNAGYLYHGSKSPSPPVTITTPIQNIKKTLISFFNTSLGEKRKYADDNKQKIYQLSVMIAVL